MLALHHHIQQAAGTKPMTLEAKAISIAIVVIVLAVLLGLWKLIPSGPRIGGRRRQRQRRGYSRRYDDGY